MTASRIRRANVTKYAALATGITAKVKIGIVQMKKASFIQITPSTAINAKCGR